MCGAIAVTPSDESPSYCGFKTESEQNRTPYNIRDSALPTNYRANGGAFSWSDDVGLWIGVDKMLTPLRETVKI
jgi:hypothetical protein